VAPGVCERGMVIGLVGMPMGVGGQVVVIGVSDVVMGGRHRGPPVSVAVQWARREQGGGAHLVYARWALDDGQWALGCGLLPSTGLLGDVAKSVGCWGARWLSLGEKGQGTHLVGAWVVVVTGEGGSVWATWQRGRWWWLGIGLWVVVDAQIEHWKILTFDLGKRARAALSNLNLLSCNGQMV
jgi:hypothetical protein